MLLYHGTNSIEAKIILEEGINVLAGKKEADFGQGFYTTPNKQFAIRRARRKAEQYGGKAVLIVIEFDEAAAKGTSKEFYKEDLVWLQFIVNNRASKEYIENLKEDKRDNNRNRNYPIVSGPTADARIIRLIGTLKREGREATEEDLETVMNPSFKKQVSFHSRYGLSFIEGIAYDEEL